MIGAKQYPNKAGALLINAAAGTTTVPTTANVPGFFGEAKGYKNWSFQVKGITSATVQIYGTLDPAAVSPEGGAQAVRWSNLITAITADGFYTYSGPLVSVAAAVTVYSSGTIYVYALVSP